MSAAPVLEHRSVHDHVPVALLNSVHRSVRTDAHPPVALHLIPKCPKHFDDLRFLEKRKLDTCVVEFFQDVRKGHPGHIYARVFYHDRPHEWFAWLRETLPGTIRMLTRPTPTM